MNFFLGLAQLEAEARGAIRGGTVAGAVATPVTTGTASVVSVAGRGQDLFDELDDEAMDFSFSNENSFSVASPPQPAPGSAAPVPATEVSRPPGFFVLEELSTAPKTLTRNRGEATATTSAGSGGAVTETVSSSRGPLQSKPTTNVAGGTSGASSSVRMQHYYDPTVAGSGTTNATDTPFNFFYEEPLRYVGEPLSAEVVMERFVYLTRRYLSNKEARDFSLVYGGTCYVDRGNDTSVCMTQEQLINLPTRGGKRGSRYDLEGPTGMFLSRAVRLGNRGLESRWRPEDCVDPSAGRSNLEEDCGLGFLPWTGSTAACSSVDAPWVALPALQCDVAAASSSAEE